jgi:hypothetical protein
MTPFATAVFTLCTPRRWQFCELSSMVLTMLFTVLFSLGFREDNSKWLRSISHSGI